MHFRPLSRLASLLCCLVLSSGCSRHESSGSASTATERLLAAEAAQSPTPARPRRTVREPSDLKWRNLTEKAFVVESFPSAPPGNAADVIQRLEPAARGGDASASYLLYLKLRECLEAVSGSNGGLSGTPSAVDECKGLAAERYAAAGQWLALAADQGSLSARLLYVSDPGAVLGDPSDMLRDPARVQAYKQKAMGFLAEEAANGSVDALGYLADAYRDGVLAPRHPATSYAYFQALRMVSPEAVPPWKLDDVASGMDATQISQATQRGREFYEQCCRR